MNAQQRKFLIETITKKTSEEISRLSRSKPKKPDLRAMILSKLMQGEMIVKSSEELNEFFRKKAFDKIEKGLSDNWLSEEDRYGGINETHVKIGVSDIFILPPEYLKAVMDYQRECREIDDKISDLQAKLNTLEIRITLASDKTLQTMINEVDDMGDLSLIDTKVKLLN